MSEILKNTAKLVSAGLILFLCTPSFSQEGDKIQLSGIILEMESIKGIPYANVYVMNSKTGVISDPAGLFSLEVEKGDTVAFSTMGRETTFFIVPDTLSLRSYSIIQKMPKDTIILKTLEVSSWPSLEQFNEAFTKEQGFDKEYAIGQKNASPLLNQIDYSKEIDMRHYNEMNGKSFTNVYPNAHIPLKDVLNPKRWDKLVNDWKSGKH